jgi:hypothetical protein
MPVSDEPNTKPLAEGLLNKTREGKINWEPTAYSGVYVATVGGNTFRVSLEEDEDTRQEYSCVRLMNEKGQPIWTIAEGVWPLYRSVQRVANKVDERIANAIEALDKL